VGWRSALSARIDDDGHSVRMILPGKTITLPLEAAPAVRALRHSDLAAGSLPGLDPQSSLVVSRRLLREGVIVPR
jgi:hypothetical protein